MNGDPKMYEYMQMAVDIVGTSAHPTNKVAATLVCNDGLIISKTNEWPYKIAAHFDLTAKIGNASVTAHAETACIFHACKTFNAQLFVTDPPCPNCAKNIAEAGIKTIYIDHKGFIKDFAIRRGSEFESMSMRILERAGIAVYKIYRKEEKIEPIIQIPDGYLPLNEYPVRVIQIEPQDFSHFIQEEKSFYEDKPFAAALVSRKGKAHGLSAQSHATLGYAHDILEDPDGKYSFVLEPLNRILMAAARKGLAIDPKSVYCSRIPTSRELVNFIAAGYQTLTIEHFDHARDIFGPLALKQLQDAQILRVLPLQVR